MAAVLYGCKKDVNSVINISSADIATINGQLKGSWVFPVKTLSVVDNNGKPLMPSQNLQAVAFAFDGAGTVTVRPDPITIQTGSYSLSTKSDGGIYMHIIYSDGSTQDFQVTQLTASTLTIASTQPYVYYSNGALVPTQAVTSTTMQKLNSADITGNLVRVVVSNSTGYNIKVVLISGGTSKLIDSLTNQTKPYAIAVPAQAGDRLFVDVVGNFLYTSINAYVDGLPVNGNISATGNETVTTDGWNISFPVQKP